MYITKRPTISFIVVSLFIYYSSLVLKVSRPDNKSSFQKLYEPKTVSNVFTSLAICLLIVGIGNAMLNWQANALSTKQATKQVTKANDLATKSNSSPSVLTPNTVPSTIKPSTNDISNYTVAPNLARYITIPSIGVHARVLSVGLTSSGAISTPSSVYDSAWYNGSAEPGQPGATLIDGHISSWTTTGVFYNLNNLRAGDNIQIQKGNGEILNYSVIKTVVYNSDNIDMNSVLSPIDPSRSGLNLISCFGDVISGTNEFNKRIVVYSSLQ